MVHRSYATHPITIDRAFTTLQVGDEIYLNAIETPFVVTEIEYVPDAAYYWLQFEHENTLYHTTVTTNQHTDIVMRKETGFEFTVNRIAHNNGRGHLLVGIRGKDPSSLAVK